jgi:phosphoribosylanthranilate isomerase
MVQVKVCGLTEPDRLAQAVKLGARFVGFIFYAPSERSLRPDVASMLAGLVPPGVETVGVFVDPTDAELETVLAEVPLDILQLHGRESPERVAEIALRTGCRVMKAVRVEEAADLEVVPDYEAVADLLLFDAKPPRTPGAIPGGNGLAFDWRLLQARRPKRPWLLAGGLTAGNVGAALELLEPPVIDVSSGVELRPGVKDPAKLDAFFAAIARQERERGALEPIST